MTRETDTAKAGPPRRDLVGIYLNDHLTGATTGTQLARRMARSHRNRHDEGQLRSLAVEIDRDRVALLGIMSSLGIAVRGYKVAAGWIAEKAGRLKFNGRVLSRSPLSDLEELELLQLGIEGKGAGWRTLRAMADTDARLDAKQLDRLILRAKDQAGQVEELRVRAADRVVNHP